MFQQFLICLILINAKNECFIDEVGIHLLNNLV